MCVYGGGGGGCCIIFLDSELSVYSWEFLQYVFNRCCCYLISPSFSYEVEIFGSKFLALSYLIYCCCAVAKSCSTLCDPMDWSMPGFPVFHYLWEFAQTHVDWVGDAIQPSYPLSPASPFALNISQLQGLFQWVGSSQQVVKVLELQLQHQYFQWIFRVDFL